jgi:DNA-binding winged helix-turn-helix (wHTH) protein
MRADLFTKTVKVTIIRLRRKLHDPDVIETFPGIGYGSLAPPLTQVMTSWPTASQATPDSHSALPQQGGPATIRQHILGDPDFRR